jgi:hypothetical protein
MILTPVDSGHPSSVVDLVGLDSSGSGLIPAAMLL